MRKSMIALTTVVLILSSCGSKSSTDKAASTTESRAPASSTTAGGNTSTSSAVAAVDVSLSEWKIESGPIKSGAVTINTKNAGKFPHELVVFKGAVADLPRTPNGSVNEGALPAGAIVGKVDRLDAGTSGSTTLNLPPGRYALVCNLVAAGQSHAAKGQIIDITVS